MPEGRDGGHMPRAGYREYGILARARSSIWIRPVTEVAEQFCSIRQLSCGAEHHAGVRHPRDYAGIDPVGVEAGRPLSCDFGGGSDSLSHELALPVRHQR
jgi:hypothetical protein